MKENIKYISILGTDIYDTLCFPMRLGQYFLVKKSDFFSDFTDFG